MAGRQLGLALDFSLSSHYALQWALDNIIRDGDTLIVLVVIRKTDQEESPEAMWGSHGSPLVPFEEFSDPAVMKRYGVTVSEDVTDCLRKYLGLKHVTVFGKVYYGDAREKLVDAILELPLDTMVMGSRGLGGLEKVFLGSVSNYVVNNAPCPITIVKLPETSIL